MQDLLGKTVVVVGGTSGMGLGGVRAAMAAGAQVVAAGRRPVETPSDLPDDRVRHIAVDMESENSVRQLFEEAAFLQQTVAEASRFMQGKFFGSWACARYAAPRMRPGGSITFLTGAASIRPAAGTTMVTATFAALEAFSSALAVELGPLRVNTIRPGVIDSDMWNFLDDDRRERLRERVKKTFPAHRIGRVDDIGHAAVFLMTNPYVTGTILEVTGGEQFAPALEF